MTSAGVSAGAKHPGASPTRRVSRLPTGTVNGGARVVPWLAAEGPLAYTPESPPHKDYFFQYGWILPGVLRPDAIRARHCYFGSWVRDEAAEAFAFWNDARAGSVARVFLKEGSLSATGLETPIAVYRHVGRLQQSLNVLIQHGSYQFLKEEDQPELPKGYVTLYRGVQKARTFRWLRFEPSRLDHAELRTWSRYLKAQEGLLSDSVLSFNSIHDRACRTETGHLNDRSRCSDRAATENGLDIAKDTFAKALWGCHLQSFTLLRELAHWKFGRNFIAFRTPLTNIRITTFVAGEHEVRIIDPNKLEPTEASGCRLVEISYAKPLPIKDRSCPKPKHD